MTISRRLVVLFFIGASSNLLFVLTFNSNEIERIEKNSKDVKDVATITSFSWFEDLLNLWWSHTAKERSRARASCALFTQSSIAIENPVNLFVLHLIGYYWEHCIHEPVIAIRKSITLSARYSLQSRMSVLDFCLRFPRKKNPKNNSMKLKKREEMNPMVDQCEYRVLLYTYILCKLNGETKKSQ